MGRDIVCGVAVSLLGVMVLTLNQVVVATDVIAPSQVSLTSTPEANELAVQIQSLVANNEECALPCFWGFEPGETGLDEIREFIQDQFQKDLVSSSTGSDGVSYHSISFDVPSASLFMRAQFMLRDEQLSLITVHLLNPSEWLPSNSLELSHLLAETDSRPDTYLAINASTERYFLLIIFNDDGIMVDYTFEFADNRFFDFAFEDPIQLCPTIEQNTAITLWLQSKSEVTPIEDRFYPTSPPGALRSDDFFWPVERLTGIDGETFIEEVVAHPEACVEAFSYVELRQRGYEI